MSRYIDVKYYFETTVEPEKAAELIASVQSTGTWKKVAGETKELIEKFGAVVRDIKDLGEAKEPSLPVKGKFAGIRRAEAVISYPHINFGSSIAMILSTVAGEAFDLNELTALKVIDIEFPEDYLKNFSGPKFGLEGCREIIGAHERPLFGAIVKPCVGLGASEIGELAASVAKAGADFIKDDELLCDPEYNRLKDRVESVSGALAGVYEETGKITMYAFNVTGGSMEPEAYHDIVKKHGGRAIMFNVLAGGFPALQKLSRHSNLPIHCHRDFAVTTFRSTKIGITSALFTKLTRLCGGDQVQCGGIGGNLYEEDEEVLESIRACTDKIGEIKPALPVSSGGMWAGKLPLNIRKNGNNDFLFLAGGGVFSHPKGGYGGMKSIIDAYQAFKQGVKLEDFDSAELKSAIEEFGEVLY